MFVAIFIFVVFPKPKSSITTEKHKGKETVINSHFPDYSPNSCRGFLSKHLLSAVDRRFQF